MERTTGPMRKENKQQLMAIKRMVNFGICTQIHKDELYDREYIDSLKMLSKTMEKIEKRYGALDESLH